MKSQISLSRFIILPRTLGIIVAAAALLGGSAFAAPASSHRLSPATADAMLSLKPLQERRDFAGMLTALDRALATAKPESYDAAFVLETKAKVLLQLNRFADAVPVFERALTLSREHGYFDAAHDARTEEILRRLRQKAAAKS